MQARHHVAASAIAAGATYAATQSPAMAAVALLSGIFVDADHLLDFVLMNRPPYTLRRMMDTYYQGRLTHVFLCLHAWEVVGIVALAAMATNWNPLATGLLIGMGHHLLLDQIFNRPYPLGYFLTYRLYKRLAYESCFRRKAAPVHNKKNP